MLISDTGASRQVELTPWRLRSAAGALAVLVSGIVVLVFFAVGSHGGANRGPQDAAQLETLKALQDEIKKKDLAIAVLEKRLREAEERPASASATSRTAPEPAVKSVLRESQPETHDDAPLTSTPDAARANRPLVSQRPPTEDVAEAIQGALSGEPASSQTELNEPTARTPIINFNAQEVTAATKGPNSGTLSFRLVKDQPDIRFQGYLFVFVEMADQRGENTIYVYPNNTRVGEEDLPTNYKEGESLSFKYNSRVELPYEDIRPGASLSRVSILLYGENGKIVFQRSFERNEVKQHAAKGGTHAEGGGARNKPGDKRRAL
jgi:hypothetical protein